MWKVREVGKIRGGCSKVKRRVLQQEEEELIGGVGEAVEAGFHPDGLIAGILFLVKVIFPLNFGREAATQRVAQQHNSLSLPRKRSKSPAGLLQDSGMSFFLKC